MVLPTFQKKIMSFVLVSADSSCCNPEGRILVYKQLSSIGWVRLNENENNGDDSVSVWMGWLITGIPEDEARTIAKEKFYSCFNPNCKPSLVFHWGETEMSPAKVLVS